MDIKAIILLFTFLVTAKGATQDEVTLLKKSDETFLKVQMEAIEAYTKAQPKNKLFQCSYKDILQSQASIPFFHGAEEAHVFGKLEYRLLNGDKNISRGVTEVAAFVESNVAEFVMLWDGVLLVTIKYFNVLYGGVKIFHVGFGAQIPKNFFHIENETLLYYDLIGCIPFTEWLKSCQQFKMKEIFLVERNYRAEIRNAVKGIFAIPLDSLDIVISNESSSTISATTEI